MSNWWEIATATTTAGPSPIRAVAYYRHSAQDRQENSIPIQQEQVQPWATEQNMEIIREFADHGKSGLTADGRPAFTDMMENWVKNPEKEFSYVLCLDVSRWGRFQDLDLSAQYSAECRRYGREVIFTSLGKPKEDDPFFQVYVQLERYRAAQYSRELSEKVWRGCAKITTQGFSAGGPPPYGLQRQLLNEAHEPVQILAVGQRKSIQNQRVTFVAGLPQKVAVMQRIFHEFVELDYIEERIAAGLNADGIPSPGGRLWTAQSIRSCLRNEKYIGTQIYNQTSQKLKSKRRRNAASQWVRKPQAFSGIISPEQFAQAQQRFELRRQKYTTENMLEQLALLYQQYGMLCPSLVQIWPHTPAATTFTHRFGSFDWAFQQLFREPRQRAQQLVQERLGQIASEVLPYEDFFVLNRKMTVAIQPVLPIPHGYTAYWPLRPDHRWVIDLTLGVLLSPPEDYAILAYVALPRWLAGRRAFRFFPTSARVEMFTSRDLTFLQPLL